MCSNVSVSFFRFFFKFNVFPTFTSRKWFTNSEFMYFCLSVVGLPLFMLSVLRKTLWFPLCLWQRNSGWNTENRYKLPYLQFIFSFYFRTFLLCVSLNYCSSFLFRKKDITRYPELGFKVLTRNQIIQTHLHHLC